MRPVPSPGARAIVGGLTWLCFLLIRRPSISSAEWPSALLLLAPLVLVPLMQQVLSTDFADGWPRRAWFAASVLQLPAAVLLAGAFLLPTGLAAGACALPWLLTTSLIAFAGLGRAFARRGLPLAELSIDAGLVYIAVGGGWTVMSRAGIQPLAFAPLIVLLTAVHFHHAGFTLPLLSGLAARHRPGARARLATAGVVAGVPLVAAGITAAQLGFGSTLEMFAAVVTATGGLFTATMYLRLAWESRWPAWSRVSWATAALTLVAGMEVAALYGLRHVYPVSWLSVPWMWRWHGTANALGFGLVGTVGWLLVRRQHPPGTGRTISRQARARVAPPCAAPCAPCRALSACGN